MGRGRIVQYETYPVILVPVFAGYTILKFYYTRLAIEWCLSSIAILKKRIFNWYCRREGHLTKFCCGQEYVWQKTRFQFWYQIRRPIVRSHKVSTSRDLYLELSDRSEIWQAPRHLADSRVTRSYGKTSYRMLKWGPVIFSEYTVSAIDSNPISCSIEVGESMINPINVHDFWFSRLR